MCVHHIDMPVAYLNQLVFIVFIVIIVCIVQTVCINVTFLSPHPHMMTRVKMPVSNHVPCLPCHSLTFSLLTFSPLLCAPACSPQENQPAYRFQLGLQPKCAAFVICGGSVFDWPECPTHVQRSALWLCGRFRLSCAPFRITRQGSTTLWFCVFNAAFTFVR